MLAYAQKMRDMIFILLVSAFFCLIANILQGQTDLAKSAIGMLILVALTVFAVGVANLPYFNKLPTVFWVSLLAVVASLPEMPLSATILDYTNSVNFLALTTPVLAYAGLSLGKDIEAFKKLSWRIVPVALASAAGCFLCATMVAQVMLHLEGAI